MAKHNSYKLPKRIAGFKIPKKVRRQAKPLLRMLDTPQFRGVVGAAVAAGLVILAVVLRFLKNRPSSPFVRGGKNRQPRLAVLDVLTQGRAAVDRRGQFVIVVVVADLEACGGGLLDQRVELVGDPLDALPRRPPLRIGGGDDQGADPDAAGGVERRRRRAVEEVDVRGRGAEPDLREQGRVLLGTFDEA